MDSIHNNDRNQSKIAQNPEKPRAGTRQRTTLSNDPTKIELALIIDKQTGTPPIKGRNEQINFHGLAYIVEDPIPYPINYSKFQICY